MNASCQPQFTNLRLLKREKSDKGLRRLSLFSGDSKNPMEHIEMKTILEPISQFSTDNSIKYATLANLSTVNSRHASKNISEITEKSLNSPLVQDMSTENERKTDKEMKNSPIYYIRLPNSSTPEISSRNNNKLKYELISKETELFSQDRLTLPDEIPSEMPNLQPIIHEKPQRLNSKIFFIRGIYTNNGKPGPTVYTEPTNQRANYLQILQTLYPKFKKAQLIR